jgi:leucyl-tRNA synthetase
MPNWAGSCWYFLRFASQKINSKSQISNYKKNPNNKEQNLFGTWDLEFRASIKKWLPVDWYLGGAEHAVLHLLYSRFWVKAMQDLGLLDFSEPFLRLRNVGMVIAEDHRKMSKSFGNIINPDDVVLEYGADALRIYEMFMAPFNQEIAWSTTALQGAYRFLNRVWKIYHSFKFNPITSKIEDDKKKLIGKLNKTIQKVTDDIPQTKFNTAIAAMMEFLNDWERFNKPLASESLDVDEAKKFLQILAPFAPFITEEIWLNVFGEKNSIHLSNWPKSGDLVVEEELKIPVQVDGRLRSFVVLSRQDLSEKKIIESAVKDEKVSKFIGGKKYKAIYVKGKILNIVLAG